MAPSYTAAGTLVQSTASSGTSIAYSVTTVNVGDLMVVFTDPSDTDPSTGVSCSLCGTFAQVGTSVALAAQTESLQMWFATVTSTGTANVTTTYGTSSTTPQASVLQFHSTLGANTHWVLDSHNTSIQSTASTTGSCAPISPLVPGSLFVANVCPSATTSNTVSPAGTVYQTNNYGDALLYNLALSATTTATAAMTSGTCITAAAFFHAAYVDTTQPHYEPRRRASLF